MNKISFADDPEGTHVQLPPFRLKNISITPNQYHLSSISTNYSHSDPVINHISTNSNSTYPTPLFSTIKTPP
jgi:hypothetical protein